MTKEVSAVCDVFCEGYKKWKQELVVYDINEQMLVIYTNEKRLRPSFRMSLNDGIFVKLLNGRTIEDKKIDYGFVLIDKRDHSFVRIVFNNSKTHAQFYIPIARECECFGCFGIPLDIAVQRGEWKVPLPIYRAIQYLLEGDNLQTDGLFRVSAAGSLLSQTRNRLDKGKDIDPSEFCDANVAAGIIKLYLRSLPDSLIPVEFSDKFMNIVRLEDPQQQIEQIKEFIKTLPEPNLFVFKYLFMFLTKVMAESKINKMVASNIAIVFSPNLLFYEDSQDGLILSKNVNDLIAKIVEHYNEICGTMEEFPGDFPKFNPQKEQVDHENFIIKKKNLILRKSVLFTDIGKKVGLKKETAEEKKAKEEEIEKEKTKEEMEKKERERLTKSSNNLNVPESSSSNSSLEKDDKSDDSSKSIQTPRGGLFDSIVNFPKNHLRPTPKEDKEERKQGKEGKKEVLMKRKSMKQKSDPMEILNMRVGIIESQIQAIFQMMIEMNKTIDAIAIKNGITPIHEQVEKVPQPLDSFISSESCVSDHSSCISDSKSHNSSKISEISIDVVASEPITPSISTPRVVEQQSCKESSVEEKIPKRKVTKQDESKKKRLSRVFGSK
ncbi:RhoGAP domain containing protein [Entamoeba histolytica HM-3:IMSS]|uniref:RhoGAP domain containing protein n=6 Tax=Entamoeba histolytica TaxID=5759 RepID=C4LX23_ENTH1|nr:RhoGAP domain containing protein [Entamoeba histolytica HM-1:IMSS]EAL47888.2 RhoGAP domain containing protein [Entamoeba histolytica HM-1:IMSS]EMS13068.1 RhoGAP domain containing protein [Entamoeba histolytica HM-3:IMSS]GAT93275.1 rhogap domain containing protein [Entamoeba histolytica]|eukprot:XP_653274.2 RhoGAP domain containing protein [Entamoeba histolytica HM-1:IMSS]